mgnify:CR=1 FL=1
MDAQTTKPTGCCEPFNPEPWQDKEVAWDNKKFIEDRVFTLFYIPMNFGSVITRMNKKVEGAGAKIPDFLCLSDHTSKWNMNLYLATDKDVPDAENVTLSGKLLSRVYEGSFRETGKWHQDFDSFVKNKGLPVKKMYTWYTTCPKCAKVYGKNYVVLFAQVG